MAIAKRIVEAHGGRIAVGEAEARGRDHPDTFPGTRATHEPSLKIAVADDELDMRDYFQQILPCLGTRSSPSPDRPRAGREVRHTVPIWSSPTSRCPTWTASTPPRRSARIPVPVILVSAYHDPELFHRAEADHILAYLVKPIKQADLEPAIAIAMRRFEQFQALRQETADLQQALEDRKIIEKAKGMLMKKAGLDEHDAFRRLQRLASDKNRKLIEIAPMILTAEEAFQPVDAPGTRTAPAHGTRPAEDGPPPALSPATLTQRREARTKVAAAWLPWRPRKLRDLGPGGLAFVLTIPGPTATPPPSPRELTQPVGGRRDDNQSGGHPQVCLGHSFRLSLAGTIRRSPAGSLIAGQQVRLRQIAADSRSLLAGIQPKPAAEPTGQLRDPIGLGQGQSISALEELASMTPGLADDEVAALASPPPSQTNSPQPDLDRLAPCARSSSEPGDL